MKAVLVLFMLGFLAPAAIAENFPSLYKSYKAALEAGDDEQTREIATAAYAAAKAEYPRGEYHAIAAYNYGLAVVGANEAASLFQESADIFEELHGDKDQKLIDPLWELGRSLTRAAKRQEALLCYARIEKLIEANALDDPVLRFDLYLDKANAYAKTGDPRRAFSPLKEAEDLLPSLAPHEAYYKGNIEFNRGKYHAALGKSSNALQSFESAVALFESVLPADAPILLIARGFLVQRLKEAGRSDEATTQLQQMAVARLGGDAAEYIPVYRTQPIFPRTAQKNGWEGYVIVELAVTPEGRVEDAVAVEASRNIFIKPALEAARKFRYAPKIIDGKPVRAKGVRYLFSFSLE